MAKILVVDDRKINRDAVSDLLSDLGHVILTAEDGMNAIELARIAHPDLVISDVLMPTMDGFEFVRQLRADPSLARTAVIFSTGTYLEADALKLAHDCGVEHVLAKPSAPGAIVRAVNAVLDAAGFSEQLRPSREFEQKHTELLTNTLAKTAVSLEVAHAELAAAYDATLEGWVRALDLRDKETEGHTQRVTAMTVRLARAIGLPESSLVAVRRGALLHDIGKLGIPDSILHKAGPLDDAEWEVMRRHPGYAYEMLSPITYLQDSLDIPYCHHEKWNGTGYPRGLKGEEIPLVARIFSVVDVWDALSTDRPYRRALPVETVRDYLLTCVGSHFDADVVDAFLTMEDGPFQSLDCAQSQTIGKDPVMISHSRRWSAVEAVRPAI